MKRETLFLDEAIPSVAAADVPRLSADECCAQIPGDEAVMEEATDYVLFYCGIDCYEDWHHRCGPELRLDHRLE